MHVNRGLLGWGVFFIVLGSVPLAVRGGALDPEVVRRAWELWPLVLIGIGLGLVLQRTPLAVLGGLVVAATFGLMGGALLATGFDGSFGLGTCGVGSSERGEPFAEQRGSFGSSADVRLELDCGDLTATTADGSGWTLAGRSHDGLPPDVRSDGSALVVRVPDRGGLAFVDASNRWDLSLPRSAATSLDLTVNAGSADLDLAGLTIRDLVLSVNAGDAHVDLGEATGAIEVHGSVNAGSMSVTLPRPTGTVAGQLTVNAGSLELCVPAGTPMRLRVGDPTLGSDNFRDRGLVRSGDTWSTPGYRDGTGTIELSLSANLGSITLDPEDGCD